MRNTRCSGIIRRCLRPGSAAENAASYSPRSSPRSASNAAGGSARPGDRPATAAPRASSEHGAPGGESRGQPFKRGISPQVFHVEHCGIRATLAGPEAREYRLPHGLPVARGARAADPSPGLPSPRRHRWGQPSALRAQAQSRPQRAATGPWRPGQVKAGRRSMSWPSHSAVAWPAYGYHKASPRVQLEQCRRADARRKEQAENLARCRPRFRAATITRKPDGTESRR